MAQQGQDQPRHRADSGIKPAYGRQASRANLRQAWCGEPDGGGGDCDERDKTEFVAVLRMSWDAASPINSVVPDKHSEAERRSGTHSHREMFGEDSELPIRRTTTPWGYGSRARFAPRDDGGGCRDRYRPLHKRPPHPYTNAPSSRSVFGISSFSVQ